MEIFDYDNVLLLPRKCRVESRSECDASVEFGGRQFKLPVVPANMKTVVDESITEWLAANGYFYVMHRFDLDNVAYAKRMRDSPARTMCAISNAQAGSYAIHAGLDEASSSEWPSACWSPSPVSVVRPAVAPRTKPRPSWSASCQNWSPVRWKPNIE